MSREPAFLPTIKANPPVRLAFARKSPINPGFRSTPAGG